MFELGIRQAVIVSPAENFRPYVGSVGISGGRLAYVGPRDLGAADAKTLIEGYGRALLPGLINAHCHGDLTVARGLGDGLTLLEQNRLFAAHNWFSDFLTLQDRAVSRELTYVEALLSGTTAIMENMFWDLGGRSVETMDKVGIRGALALDIRPDFSKPDTYLSDTELRDFHAACVAADLMPLIGSVSEEDFSPSRLQQIAAILKRLDLRSTCHLSETVWRVERVQQLYGQTPVELLAAHGMFDSSVLASHMVHLTETDIRLTAERQVRVVNTPVSEMKIQDGIAPVPDMLAAGIPVALGTDGALWNNGNDMFREMKTLLLLHSLAHGVRSLAPEDVLRMATVHGAQALGLEHETGDLQEGLSADLILIDLEQPHLQPLGSPDFRNLPSLLVTCATGRDVTDVFVRGEHLVQSRQLQRPGLPELLQQARAAFARIEQGLAAQA